MEDPDIECIAVTPAGASGDFSSFVRSDERWRGLPESPSELFAYDAIILSNVPREALSDQHLAWVEEWIARRGGGASLHGRAVPNELRLRDAGTKPPGRQDAPARPRCPRVLATGTMGLIDR